jgi:hypothetical protein
LASVILSFHFSWIRWIARGLFRCLSSCHKEFLFRGACHPEVLQSLYLVCKHLSCLVISGDAMVKFLPGWIRAKNNSKMACWSVC